MDPSTPGDAAGDSTLAAQLEAGPLRPEAVARLGVQACRELAASPLAGPARRDFCPAAVKLEASPAGDVAVAIQSPARDEGARRSPMYLSPEQVTHASKPDARSDVYSLSMVLYEALAGAGTLPLPQCATEGELLTTLVTHDPRPLSAVAPWVDPALCRVIDRGLQREPERRWQSTRELGEALRPFTGGTEQIPADLLAGMTAGDRVPFRRREPPAAAAQPAGRRVAAIALAVVAVLFVAARGAILAFGVWRTGSEIVERARPEAPFAHSTARASEPGKKEVATALLEKPSFFIHFDPRRPGVLVPEQFRKQPQLVLQVGLALAVPIPDLDVGDAGITGTLSFSRKPFLCKIPWGAVYALVDEDGRGKVWSADVPPEVAAETARKKAAGDAGE